MDDDAIRVLVRRLARAHPSGGMVIERAAVVAEGTGSEDVMTWIVAHGGKPEAAIKAKAPRGLHGLRYEADPGSRPASRFVLPAGALDD
ncbi:MAG: hypothetical protein QOG94_2271 [Solirubrobacteraceae bacterium]|nr:hypothetical protein [Solirubrobacteraceae bacterium]MEA2137394.1 hypothetical protein [Solirubrobacteraceae bacterium]